MSNDLLGIIDRLVGGKVDFVIVGGFAATIYGSTIVTQDIDICCDFTPTNLMRLQKALAGLNPVHRMTPKRIALELDRRNCCDLKNLYLDTDLGVLDCLSYIDGVGDFRQVKQSSTKLKDGGRVFRVLNMDALIEAKKAMNRPRDKQTLSILLAIKEQKKQD
jgi:hypothetical protein